MLRLVPLAITASACNQLLDIPEVQRGACDPEARFKHVAPVVGLEGELGTQGAGLSHDELTIVFSRVTAAGSPDEPVQRYGDLYTAHRDQRGDAFRDVTALDELNTDSDEFSASLSDDQRTVYFDRQDAAGRYHILSATRPTPESRFDRATPVALGGGVWTDVEPFITPTAIYFASTRGSGYASLFVAEGQGTSFAAPTQLLSVETRPDPTAYEDPVVSLDGLTLYFSAPPDGTSPRGIWSASRLDRDEPFEAPRAPLSLPGAAWPIWISDDSCRLYFATGRPSTLWLASRREL